jgi:two-component system sensor histidine kinase PilS (NtrC family)
MAVRGAGNADRLLESRLKWLMLGRLALAVVSLVAILFFRPLDTAYPPYYVLLAACLVNLVYLVAVRMGVRLRPLAFVQILVDVLLLGILVYLTGIDRFFAYLYLPAIIAAAMILGARMAMTMASVASVILAAVSTLYFLAGEAAPALRLPLVEPGVIQGHSVQLSFLFPFLFLFSLSLHLAAVLVGKLTAEASRVRVFTDEILINMAGGVLAADRFGGIQFINSQAAHLLGLRDAESALGRQMEEVLPRPIVDLLRRAVRGQERAADEFRLNGSLVDIAVSCIQDGERGPLRGVVAILNDLSLRTQMEEMTRRAERFGALLEMSAGMAHEIRNPLASIRGAAQELQSSKPPQEEDRQLLQVVIRESDRLDQIISEFLDYASDRPIEMGLCNLAEVLRETLLLLEARGARNVEIRSDLPRSALVQGSADKLKQVFLNLGLNALDACQEEVKISRLWIRCAPARGPSPERREGVRVEVQDEGCGIPRDNLPRVFDPFFTTKPHGVGMGLAIARKIVHAHRGEISVESHPVKGTTFRVWLPV